MEFVKKITSPFKMFTSILYESPRSLRANMQGAGGKYLQSKICIKKNSLQTKESNNGNLR